MARNNVKGKEVDLRAIDFVDANHIMHYRDEDEEMHQ